MIQANSNRKFSKQYVTLFILIFSAVAASAQWQKNNLDTCSITSLASNGNNLYAGTHGGMYISENSGSTWKFTDFQRKGAPIFDIAHNGGRLFAAFSTGLRSSDNNGSSWQWNFQLINRSIYAFSIEGNTIYTASYFGLHKSDDNGAKWINIGEGLPNDILCLWCLYGATEVLVNKGDIFAVYDSTLYRSVDSGKTYELSNTGISGLKIYELLYHDSTLLACTNKGVYVSADYGAQWSESNNGLPVSPVYNMIVHDSMLIAGTNSGVYRSVNNGADWISVSAGLPDEPVYSLTVNGTNLFAGLSTKIKSNALWSIPLSEFTGIKNQNKIAVNIFPNPVQGHFTVTGTVDRIEISDPLGRILMHYRLNPGDVSADIDMTNCSKGVYMVTCYYKTGNYTTKILVE